MSCYFTLLYCFLDMTCGECNVIFLYFLCFSVNGSICLVCSESDSVCEILGVFLLNVMEVLNVGGGALLDGPCMVFLRKCVLCL